VHNSTRNGEKTISAHQNKVVEHGEWQHDQTEVVDGDGDYGDGGEHHADAVDPRAHRGRQRVVHRVDVLAAAVQDAPERRDVIERQRNAEERLHQFCVQDPTGRHGCQGHDQRRDQNKEPCCTLVSSNFVKKDSSTKLYGTLEDSQHNISGQVVSARMGIGVGAVGGCIIDHAIRRFGVLGPFGQPEIGGHVENISNRSKENATQ